MVVAVGAAEAAAVACVVAVAMGVGVRVAPAVLVVADAGEEAGIAVAVAEVMLAMTSYWLQLCAVFSTFVCSEYVCGRVALYCVYSPFWLVRIIVVLAEMFLLIRG